MRGTDYTRYRKYLDYFITNDLSKIELESGVSYYWFISKIFDLLKTPIFISEIYIEPVITASIQIGNLIFYIIGMSGLYKLLQNLDFKFVQIMRIFLIVSTFVPIIGARMILKPEIMAFAFLPWIIFLYNKFFETKNSLYILFSVPIISIVLVLKSSISFMIALSLIMLYGKKIFDRRIVTLNIISVILGILLIRENFLINGNYIWEHIVENNYNNKASLSYIFSFNPLEMFRNPFRNSLKDSMIAIILTDTFGDYWQRYWFHKDGWSGELFPGNINLIRVSIIISIFFYLASLYFLIKEKNHFLKKLGLLGYVGIFALIVNAINLFPFLTKNFDPSKGDPMKSHLFSFLIIFTFIYVLIKINVHTNSKIFLFTFIFFNMFFFFMAKGVSFSEVKSSSFFLNKIHVVTPCISSKGLESIISFSDSWCNEEQLSKSLCKGDYDPSVVPYEEDGYIIFPQDSTFVKRNLTNGYQDVTVANYFECINYASGGFFIQSSREYINNNHEGVLFNKLILSLSLIICLCLLIFDKKVKFKI